MLQNLLIIIFLSATACFSATRNELVDIARSAIGQREASGHNDGVFVDQCLQTVGLEGTGSPWCAAFDRWCYDQAKFHSIAPRSALAADWVHAPTWKQGHGQTPLPGDTFGIYFPRMGGVHHTGLIEKWEKSFATTIEGNTNDAGSREGDGVYRKKRSVRQIYAVKNWIETYGN